MHPGKGFVELSAEGKLYHMVASGNKNSCNCTLLQPQALEPQAPSYIDAYQNEKGSNLTMF